MPEPVLPARERTFSGAVRTRAEPNAREGGKMARRGFPGARSSLRTRQTWRSDRFREHRLIRSAPFLPVVVGALISARSGY